MAEEKVLYTAFCKNENRNLVTIRNIKASGKDHAFQEVLKMNPNLKIITILTDKNIQEIKDILDGNEN